MVAEKPPQVAVAVVGGTPRVASAVGSQVVVAAAVAAVVVAVVVVVAVAVVAKWCLHVDAKAREIDS